MKADSLHMVRCSVPAATFGCPASFSTSRYAWEKTEWQTLLTDIFSVYEIYDDEHPT